MRKQVLAAIAALVAVWLIALPSAADAQQRFDRGDGQGRGRGQVQQAPIDARRGGGFSGMLGDIAGARLNRSHIDKRPQSRDGGGGGNGGGKGQRGGRGNGGGF